MRIGIYGGSFNPPHVGHLRAASFALDALNLDKMLLIPAGVAPHKQLAPFSPTPEQRLAMVRLAAEDTADPRLGVSDLEISREGLSYTYCTVQMIREQYPRDELFLLMGTDMFLSLDKWRSPEKIFREVQIGVLYRGDPEEVRRLAEKQASLAGLGCRATLLHNPVTELSSTEIRRYLLLSCIGDSLSPSVSRYIRENGLYGTGEDLRGLSADRLRELTEIFLKPKRIPHVMGCMETCMELAKRWGGDEALAQRAGLLHDITKALPDDRHRLMCREYGIPEADYAHETESTFHQFTGALAAERVFGECREVVDAIRFHTTGRPGMTLLEKIVYIGDYIEPTRDFPGVETLRKAAFEDLDAAVCLGLSRTVDFVKAKGGRIAPMTQAALTAMQTETDRKEGKLC